MLATIEWIRIGCAGLWLVLTSVGCGSRMHVGAAAPTSDPALSPGVLLGLQQEPAASDTAAAR